VFLAHSFRLRDPWQCEATPDGGTRWSRVFHRPTGLEPDDELVLVISGLPPEAKVTINGQAFSPDSSPESPASSCATGVLPVPAPGTDDPPPPGGSRTPRQPAQYKVTSILTDANQIQILLPPAPNRQPPASRFPYDARLAIIGHS
jgi:hypothetical protein